MVIWSMVSKVDTSEVEGYRKVSKTSLGDREVTDLDLLKPDSMNKGEIKGHWRVRSDGSP